jgi:hypothetical protein
MIHPTRRPKKVPEMANTQTLGFKINPFYLAMGDRVIGRWQCIGRSRDQAKDELSTRPQRSASCGLCPIARSPDALPSPDHPIGYRL